MNSTFRRNYSETCVYFWYIRSFTVHLSYKKKELCLPVCLFDKKNSAEMQTITALVHLNCDVVYCLDTSNSADFQFDILYVFNALNVCKDDSIQYNTNFVKSKFVDLKTLETNIKS